MFRAQDCGYCSYTYLKSIQTLRIAMKQTFGNIELFLYLILFLDSQYIDAKTRNTEG